MSEVTLPQAIDQLRRDLAQAQEEGRGQAIQLAIKEIQVELSIVAKTGVEGGGGIKAWVIDVSAKGSKASESGHKIVLKLEARNGTTGELLVANRKRMEDE